MVLYAGSSAQSPAQEENKQHNPLPVWGLGDEALGTKRDEALHNGSNFWGHGTVIGLFTFFNG